MGQKIVAVVVDGGALVRESRGDRRKLECACLIDQFLTSSQRDRFRLSLTVLAPGRGSRLAVSAIGTDQTRPKIEWRQASWTAQWHWHEWLTVVLLCTTGPQYVLEIRSSHGRAR